MTVAGLSFTKARTILGFREFARVTSISRLMTLDDFLQTLETLIDERETSDDNPGQGNFNCEGCRKCNNCRFCVACDSCEDCTYCDESIDCTSCTRSKRCVDCEKVSYCDDCRDCKASQYLTLCVECSECVHCLACVGLEGVEFYVLNQKRTRKEYFALLRQVQELMQLRMGAGWRPPGIGIASDIDDPIVARRDTELSAAPWLELEHPRVEPSARRGGAWDDRDDHGRDDHSRDRSSRLPPTRRGRSLALGPRRLRARARADPRAWGRRSSLGPERARACPRP